MKGGAMRLDGTVALITGASDGIGRCVATRFAARGARVLVHGRDPERTRAVAEQVDGTPLLADLASPGARSNLVQEATRQFGPIDILVNNAGIGWSGPFTQMSVDDIRRLLEVDLVAAIELSRAVLPAMVERKFGAMCFVSSVAGRTGVAGEAVYSAAKAALDAFADSVRAEAAGSGVRVGVVVPGAVSTGFFAKRGREYDRARPKPVPADAVANAVLRTVAGEKAEVWIPRWLRVGPVVRTLAPSAYRRLVVRFGESIRLAQP